MSAFAQSFNIDLDVGFGDPGIGHGAPSSSFGGAAKQPGFWNRFGFGGIPVSVIGLDGLPTSVVMSRQSSHGQALGGGFAFTGNTGDYALLLNDAASVGTQVQGGAITYLFSSLSTGLYHVYTYAANVAGIPINTPITIPGATPATETVTGPMPGNAVQHLITHSIHDVEVGMSGKLQIEFLQPPGMHTNMNVNGFQVVLVPEPKSTIAMILGSAYALLRKRIQIRQGIRTGNRRRLKK
jgi:hypothetical protein